MKSRLIFLIWCLFSWTCYSSDGVNFTISAGKSGNDFLLTINGQTDIGSELLDSWYNKAKELCGNKNIMVGPNDGKPIVRNTECGDTMKIENGIEKCELVKAYVFGKVSCIAT